MGSVLMALDALLWSPLGVAVALLSCVGALWLTQHADRPDEPGGRDEPDTRRAPRDGSASGRRPLRIDDAMLGVISHELRGPLNAILGWTQLLEPRRDVPSDVQDALKVIRRNALRQRQILDEVADVGRLLGGGLAVERRPMRLADAVDEACRAAHPYLAAKGVNLACESAGVDALVAGDADRLAQAIAKLLARAERTTPAGGSVRVALERRDDQVVLTIADTGEGLAPPELKHVFEPSLGRSATRPSGGGLGFDLAFVRAVAEAHDGTVRADSAGRGQGSAFTLSLPVLAGASSERVAPRGDRVLEGLKVLAVDDEGDWCELLRRVLIAAGADARVLCSGRDAIEVTGDWWPDVLLTDISMPATDGYAVLAALRARPHRPPLRAVAMTAHAGPQERTRTAAAGFDAHLAKPVAPHEIVDAIRRVAGDRARPRRSVPSG
jgi:signal transduction histidine kinase/CheY-like chemotaxis protein